MNQESQDVLDEGTTSRMTLSATPSDRRPAGPMKMKAFAPWAGCKRMMAARYIVPLLGPHHAYWEPFCGGAAVFLAKPPTRIEVLNDLHGDLTNLIRTIADPKLSLRLYRRLRDTMFCEALHTEAQESLQGARAPLDRAYFYFIKVWMSWGGVAGTTRAGFKMSIRYTNKGGHQAARFRSAVASISAWKRRLRHATILNQDAFELIARIDDAPETVIYVDPPYLEKRLKYEHDLLALDHIRLAQALHKFKRTRIVLSYYDHAALRDLYPDWTCHKIEVTKALAQMARRESERQRVVEVLLVNKSCGGQLDLFAERKTGSILKALDEIYEAGGKVWDDIDDPDKYLKEMRGEDE